MVTVVTSALLPLLAPVADWAHVLLTLPVFLPLAAWALRAARAASAPGPAAARRPWALPLLAAWVVAVTAPFVHMLGVAPPAPVGTAGRLRPGDGDRRSPPGRGRRARRRAPYCARTWRPDERVLVMPSQAMLYFLSGRRSALEQDEFFFYAATTGPQLSADDARRFVDEAAAIRRLDAERPLVVRGRGPPPRVSRDVFPTLADVPRPRLPAGR